MCRAAAIPSAKPRRDCVKQLLYFWKKPRAWGRSPRGVLLEHTTSYDVRPERAPEDFVGYAAIVY